MERLIPVLMTVLTTGPGLIPFAISGSLPAYEIQTPLAVVVLFGLSSSTIVNMSVVPSLLLRWACATPPGDESTRNGITAGTVHNEHASHRNWSREDAAVA